jgi:hypothetical protein
MGLEKSKSFLKKRLNFLLFSLNLLIDEIFFMVPRESFDFLFSIKVLELS